MTIDLGFAWLKLPGGREVGIVDVPGHEGFIKNMLAVWAVLMQHYWWLLPMRVSCLKHANTWQFLIF